MTGEAPPSDVDTTPLAGRPKRPSVRACGRQLWRQGPASPRHAGRVAVVIAALLKGPAPIKIHKPIDHAALPVSFQVPCALKEPKASAAGGASQAPRQALMLRR